MLYRYIDELNDLHYGKTAIVIGNGPSRDKYDVNDMFYGCIKIGCNMGFRKNRWLDFICFQDDNIYNDCMAWAGNKIALWKKHSPTSIQVLGGVYYFIQEIPRYGMRPHFPAPYTTHLAFGSTGFVAAQMALRMGCVKIVLVGCDCEPSEHKNDKYYGFRKEFEYFRDHCKANDVELFKLGKHGAVDMPVIEPEDV